MTNTTKRILFFQKFSNFTNVAKAMGINFLVTCYHRTQTEQKKLYDEGKSQCDGYNEKSKHQDWLAIDIVITKGGRLIWDKCEEYETLGKIWTEIFGGIWGGNWESIDDPYHFQFKGA